METDHHHLQALIQETAALNCDDPFPLDSVPLELPNQESFCFLGRILSPNPPAVYWVREILNQAWKFALPFDVVFSIARFGYRYMAFPFKIWLLLMPSE
jgi:hypothetical protein